MKKHTAILLLAMTLLLSLCACTQEQKQAAPAPYTVGTYTVTPYDNNAGTLSDGTYTYSYRYEPYGAGYSVTFTYPDGETYTCVRDGSGVRGSASLDLDLAKYPSGLALNGALERAKKAVQRNASPKNVGLIVLFLLIGAVNTAAPKAAWFLEVGWKLKDAEPSDAALAWNRGIGILLLIIAAVMLIV